MDEQENLRNRIQNKDIRKGLGVANIKESMKENCLIWLGHVERWDISVPVRKIKKTIAQET